MARFRYKAVSADGRSLSGEAVAADPAALASDLGERGLMLVSVDAMKGGDGGLFTTTVSQRSITAFLSELALMLRSGLPLDEALDLIGGGLPTRLARVVAAMRTDVLGGANVVQALERHPTVFSKDIVAMARVADTTSNLEGVLEAVAAERERTHRLTEKVVGSLRYPAFLILSAVGVLVFFLIQVIPQFAGLFADSGSDPGALVRFVLGLSEFLVANTATLAAAAAALLGGALLVARIPRARGTVVTTALRLPGINGIWQLWRASRFLSLLSIMLGQGVPTTEALRVIEDAIGFDGRAKLAAVRDAVRRGGRLHEALAASKLLPAVALRMVRIGEESGELPKIAGDAGLLYARQLEKRLDKVSGIVGPVAILVIAGMIGGLMVTIMSALISVNQAVL